METKAQSMKKEKVFQWIKKFGVWGFLFFLAKGIFWLIGGAFVIDQLKKIIP